MILLDTHAWLWWLGEPNLLSPAVRDRIGGALDDAQLGVASISAWETAMLVAKGRIELTLPVEELVATCERLQGFSFLPLTARIAVAASRLAPLYPDPADRFIVATAISANATLVTKDERLRAFPGVRTIW